MAKPAEFTDANFETEVLKSDLPVLVDFWAEWCGPCKMIAPTIEQLAGEYEGKLKVGKIDVDVHQQMAMKYNVRGIPTLLIFKNGEPAGMQVGAKPKGALADWIKSVG